MTVKRSAIGWTDFSGGDANFEIGCTKISSGCLHCYAKAIIERIARRDFDEVRCYPEKLKRLASAKFEAQGTPFRRGTGSRAMVFVCDLGDLFHPRVPVEFVMDALTVMACRTDVDWQVLTKRAARMSELLGYWCVQSGHATLPDNIWPGVTVETGIYRDRARWLLTVPSRRRFVSVEPMLEPWPLTKQDLEGIAWVICGAESGPARRRFEECWAADLYYQCQGEGVAFFGKQDSGLRPGAPLLIGGVEVKEFPA